MYLNRLALQNFRGYTKSEFTFSQGTTLVVGPNTVGKTNLIEAIFLLSSGKSFHAEKDTEMIQFDKSIARVSGEIEEGKEKTMLEVVIATNGNTLEGQRRDVPDGTSRSYSKKYVVNAVPKRRVDFVGQIKALLFVPADLDIIVGSPSLRRSFFDNVLELTDREYRLAHTGYTKALRQRNALLEHAREVGRRNERLFEYWDELLIGYGETITSKREAFAEFINNAQKELINFSFVYDKSTISKARLLQYKDAELGAGITLVGPQRDDFAVFLKNGNEEHDAKLFGSRGQQRLVILQLKLLQLDYVTQTGEKPLLLLDDIFSELDTEHIQHVMDIVKGQQTIITTTHKEFIDKKHLKDMSVIELGK